MGLGPYTLSMDQIRHIKGAPVLNAHGTFGISQDQNMQVHDEFMALVEERMMRGELLALDTTFTHRSDLKPYLALAERWRYRLGVIDFSSMPLAQVYAQNKMRDELWQVPEHSIERLSRALAAPLDDMRADVTVHHWTPDGSLAERVNAWLTVPVQDFSRFAKVVHIGDLQGCLDVLINGPLKDGFRDDTAYVFVGDMLDRGPQNGVLMRWLLDNAIHRDNVFCMWGNHEDHPHRWSRGLPAVSPEFIKNTLPQLLAAGITPKDADRLCAKAIEVLPYTFGEHRVFVCHAGLSTMPEKLHLVSLAQYAKGTGHWEDPVDAQFTRHAPGDWVQVHGHRNHGRVGVHAADRSFNLEDGVEHGGHLRTATLDAQGWSTQEYRNTYFTPYRQREKRRTDKAPKWMSRESEVRMDDSVLAEMVTHNGVRKVRNKTVPHVVSLNFTKDVFYDKSWDDVVIKARGLFLNEHTQEIVARGYEKFFNVGERPETRMEALGKNLVWPVTGYVKENGYLGNLGYDPETDELFVSSKSTPDGEFAQWFREILDDTVSKSQQESIRRWLRDMEASMVFEVNDPVRDPHMIDYDKAHLVLLDVFHRSPTMEKLPFDELQKVAESFGLTCKRRGIQFKNFESFQGWYDAATSDLTWRYREEDIEGLVLEDAAGFQTKVKLPHYAFWKRMRSAKTKLAPLLLQKQDGEAIGLAEKRDAVLEAMTAHKQVLQDPNARADAARAKGARVALQDLGKELAELQAALRLTGRRGNILDEIQKVIERDPHPLAHAFLSWCATLPAQRVTEEDILQLRKAFLVEAKPDPELWKVPWVAFDPTEMDLANEPEHASELAEGFDPAAETAKPRKGPKR